MNYSQFDIEKIPSIPVAVVAIMMGFSAEYLQYGIQQGVFPWAYAIKTGKDRWRYWINRNKFCEIEKVPVDVLEEYEKMIEERREAGER